MMDIAATLLLPLKQQVNAVEFDGDDLLLKRNIKRALSQLLSICHVTLDDIAAMSETMDENELEEGLPVDFAGAILELAAAMYRYGEAYADTVFRFTPSFEMTVSRYRRHYNPTEEEDESA